MQQRPAPEVIGGLRSPENMPAVGAQAEISNVPVDSLARYLTTPDAAEGEVVYVSDAFGLRIQITSPATRFDPATGAFHQDDPKVAQFSRGVYRTKEKKVIRELESHPRFGRLFHRLDKVREQAKEAKYNAAKQTVLDNPETLTRLLTDLGLTSLPLPATPTPPGEATP